jgi:hypothetical protein
MEELNLNNKEWLDDFLEKLRSKQGHPLYVLLAVGGKHGLSAKFILWMEAGVCLQNERNNSSVYFYIYCFALVCQI